MTRRKISIFSPDAEIAEILDRHRSAVPKDKPRGGKLNRWVNSLRKRPERSVLYVVSLDRDSNATPSKFRVESNGTWVLLCDRDFPREALPDHMVTLGVKDPSRVHVHTTRDHGDTDLFLGRLVSAVENDRPEHRIVDAYWLGDTFAVVEAPNLAKMMVSIQDIKCLRSRSPDDLANFEIDDDGSFVYWPSIDVHLGWEQFAQAADPAAFVRAQQESEQFNKKYGSAIRQLREGSRLKQSDIAGLTARQVGRIERGECRATRNALSKLAEAHSRPLSVYLAQLAEMI